MRRSIAARPAVSLRAPPRRVIPMGLPFAEVIPFPPGGIRSILIRPLLFAGTRRCRATAYFLCGVLWMRIVDDDADWETSIFGSAPQTASTAKSHDDSIPTSQTSRVPLDLARVSALARQRFLVKSPPSPAVAALKGREARLRRALDRGLSQWDHSGVLASTQNVTAVAAPKKMVAAPPPSRPRIAPDLIESILKRVNDVQRVSSAALTAALIFLGSVVEGMTIQDYLLTIADGKRAADLRKTFHEALGKVLAVLRTVLSAHRDVSQEDRIRVGRARFVESFRVWEVSERCVFYAIVVHEPVKKHAYVHALLTAEQLEEWLTSETPCCGTLLRS